MIKRGAVASFTDAWIETNCILVFIASVKSHLLQMRGLKLCVVLNNNLLSHVASFTDAWIETLGLIRDKTFIKSHLLQMRGLKRELLLPYRDKSKSHLLQMRGLKH